LLYPIEREKQVTSKLALYIAQKKGKRKKKSRAKREREGKRTSKRVWLM
jgi:hypothetical protein